MAEEIKNEDKLLAALSYPIPFLPLFLIFTDKKNVKFCWYHGWQALFWQIGWVILLIVPVVVSIILSLFSLGCLLTLITPIISLANLAVLVISIIFCVKTYSGEYLVIPYISEFAKKYHESPQ